MALGIKTFLNNLRTEYINSEMVFPDKRRSTLIKRGHTLADDTIICPHTQILGKKLTTHRGVFINRSVIIDTVGAPVILEKNVHIAQNVLIVTRTHSPGISPEFRCGAHEDASVTIGVGSWLGAGVIILPGVDIATGCIIAGGSVATKSTEPNGLYAGVPARRVKDLPA
ncbi:acyltransferase [Rothia nasisuis]|uniref:acyltransferase n=1 Tax=Rothia nasisuis TaxID=2109647 RepID=UPI001F2284CA|nr:acyltransferase [Rothia nasisuis]